MASDVGHRIQEACTALAVTPAALARDVGVSRQYISLIISGEKSGESYLQKIAERLGVHVAWLTTGAPTLAPPWSKDAAAVQQLQVIIGQLTQQLEALRLENQQQAERISELERVRRGPRRAAEQ